MLPQETPIYWIEDEETFVNEGDEYLIYEVHYGSPCSTLTRHPNLIESSRPPIYQQKQPPPTIPTQNAAPQQTIASIPPRLIQPSYSPMQQPIYPKPPRNNGDDIEDDETEEDPPYHQPQGRKKRTIGLQYLRQCEAVFREVITTGLTRFRAETKTSALNENLEKVRKRRQLEFVAGFVISNILTTAKDWLVTRTSSRLEERLANAENRLVSLNAQQDLMLISQKALAKTLSVEQKAINQIQGQIAQLADINVLLDYYISEMQMVKSKHDRLWGSIRTGNPDLTTISEIFDTAVFGRLRIRDIERVYVENPYPNVLRIRVEGPIRSKSTFVYNVVTFPYYGNFSGKSGHKLEYHGNLRLIRNNSANCVKGIGTATIHKHVTNTCEEPNYKDSNLKLWKTTFIPDLRKEELRPVASIVWPYMRFQCFTKNITITNIRNKTYTTSCPSYVTSLHLQNTFRTSDGIINHIGGGTKTLQYVPKTTTDVLEYHFDEFTPIHKELEGSLRQAEELLRQQEQSHNTSVALFINNTPVTYFSLTLTIVILIIMINITLLVMLIRKKRAKYQPPTTIPKNTNTELRELQHQLNDQGSKLDTLLRAANEIESASVASLRTHRRPARVSRNFIANPRRDMLQYTAVVPTVLDV